MNNLISSFLGWFGWGGSALGARSGKQSAAPSGALINGTIALGPDGALQISTVWSCVWLLANVIASLPLFVYANQNGKRDLARDTLLYQLLHDSPNSRMTPMEFWVAMLLNLLLRGNAYARIERNDKGEAFALWPMPADQVEMNVLKDGSVVYLYRIDNDVAALSEANVLHIREIGNGSIGMARLDYMRATTSEATNAQVAANKLFANGGKPTGILMVDKVLKPEQRYALRANFSEMAEGTTSRLVVLEANMKYQQVNLSPADQQLLETRKFAVEEVCRWFGVPPVLVGHSNVTAWGTGVEQIIEGFYKTTVGPMLIRLNQSIAKRVLTPAQRARQTVEFSFDALLRTTLEKRMEIYAKASQNGIYTRNECRQLENMPPIAGGDELTAQSNLAPLGMLGRIRPTGGASDKPIAQ